MKFPVCFGFLLVISCFVLPVPICAEEHVIERGETALQIAIDHNLTMEQLQQINPDVDLEMMLVGDVLIIPDEGMSFQDFLNAHYGKMIRITDLNCEVMADGRALCLFHAENLSALPLFDVRFEVSVEDAEGAGDRAEGGIALMQILPEEKVPAFLEVPGPFRSAVKGTVSVTDLSYSDSMQSSFRIPEEMFDKTESFLPDRIGVTETIIFHPECLAQYEGRHVNVLSAGYDASGVLVGVRSLYSEFYPRLDITVYSNDHPIESVRTILEVY